tara:strand:- start:622 stop:1542 length:921 start_codon:yes stop_codon:yes gene_type:complete
MILDPLYQNKLYGLEKEFKELVLLYKKNKLPNKILFSGPKGSGKCTLSYHLINFILSSDDDFPYDDKNFSINVENRSYKLMLSKTCSNFNLIDIAKDKKNIDISQIRSLINYLNKSSINSKPKFILIDNIEFLNVNSINALLKVLEEPNKNTFFILINNNKRILPTLKSRCLNFKISLSNAESIKVLNKIIGEDVYKIVNKDLINYYSTPGNIINLINFSKDFDFDLTKYNLKDFLVLIIEDSRFKKHSSFNFIFYNFLEFFLRTKNSLINSNYYHNLIRKIDKVKRYNLDEESLFIEFKEMILNE